MKILKIQYLWILILASIPDFGCDLSEISKTDTIVSDFEVYKRIRAFEKRYKKEDICHDASMAFEIVNDFYGTKYSLGCSRETHEVMMELSKVIKSTNDLHAKVEFGFQLDEEVSPVIIECTGSEICLQINGSQLKPLDNSFGKIYAFVESHQLLRKISLFEVLERNGTGVDTGNHILQDLYTLQPSERSFFVSHDLLSRSAFDVSDKGDEHFLLRDINSEELLSIKTSYSSKQKKGFQDSSAELKKVRLAYPSSCKESVQASSAFVCETLEGNVYVRVDNWFVSDEELDLIFDQISRFSVDSKVLIDVRSNRGGSHMQALKFLCFVDLDHMFNVAGALDYLIFSPKRYYGSVHDFLSLVSHMNKDLIKVRDDLRTDRFLLPVSSRFKVSCSFPSMLKNRQISVLTEGNEFSANEFFLQILGRMPNTTIIGRKTIGGSGSPVSITLPRTGMKITVSVARIVDQKVDLIEKIGIIPDLEFDFKEEAKLFEERFRSYIKSEKETCIKCFQSDLFKKIQFN